jgi:hypothetical protein
MLGSNSQGEQTVSTKSTMQQGIEVRAGPDLKSTQYQSRLCSSCSNAASGVGKSAQTRRRGIVLPTAIKSTFITAAAT